MYGIRMSQINLTDSDGSNPELKNSDSIAKTKVSSEPIKNSLKSSRHKKIRPTQTNDLTGWLTKDLSHCKPSKSNKDDVLKVIEYNVGSELQLKKQNLKKKSTSVNITSPKKKKKKKRKSLHSSPEKKCLNDIHVDRKRSGNDDCESLFTNIPCVLDGTSPDKESLTREKFKNIAISPLSQKNLGIESEFDKNKNSPSCKLSRWLSKYDRNPETKETLDKKECNKNINRLKLATMEEDTTNTSKQIKDKLPELKSSDFMKEKVKSFDQDSYLDIKCDTEGVDVSKESCKSKKKQESPKYIKQDDKRSVKCSPISEVNNSTEKIEKANNVRDVPKSQKSSISGTRKLFDVDLFSQSPTTNIWLKKDMSSSKLPTKNNDKKKKERVDQKNAKYKQLDVTTKKKSTGHTLDYYLNNNTKESSKRKSDSNTRENPLLNNNKKQKTNRASESFKKYGVKIPSVEEIIKDQKEFAEYKNQLESFKEIENQCFELPFSIKELKQSPEVNRNILGCKHLSLDRIEKLYDKNLDYISTIFHGEKYSERHERFFEKNVKNYTFTLKDLCYNTSTIVFTFEQTEHMISLMKRDFDPDDKWTFYFFQVLLPELCLKIFMDTHSMTYDEAVKYLDTRPIED